MDIARTLHRADGVTLAYRLWRPGPPRRLIVLVHGLASNHTRRTEFVRATRLRESWDLLRPDLRGFGGSLSRGHAGVDIWCEDLAAIMRAEAATRAVVVGHCLRYRNRITSPDGILYVAARRDVLRWVDGRLRISRRDLALDQTTIRDGSLSLVL